MVTCRHRPQLGKSRERGLNWTSESRHWSAGTKNCTSSGLPVHSEILRPRSTRNERDETLSGPCVSILVLLLFCTDADIITITIMLIIKLLANRLKCSFYSSESVFWFRGSIQSSFTRLFQWRTIPTRNYSSLFLILVLTSAIFTSWGTKKLHCTKLGEIIGA